MSHKKLSVSMNFLFCIGFRSNKGRDATKPAADDDGPPLPPRPSRGRDKGRDATKPDDGPPLPPRPSRGRDKRSANKTRAWDEMTDPPLPPRPTHKHAQRTFCLSWSSIHLFRFDIQAVTDEPKLKKIHPEISSRSCIMFFHILVPLSKRIKFSKRPCFDRFVF